MPKYIAGIGVEIHGSTKIEIIKILNDIIKYSGILRAIDAELNEDSVEEIQE